MFKRAKVVMLPTAIKPYKMPYDKHIPESNLILGLQESLNYSKTLGFKKSPDESKFHSLYSIGNYSKQMYQHLYITSDEEIKEGDWFLYLSSEIPIVYKCSKIDSTFERQRDECSKIIATTDSSLKIEVDGYRGELLPDVSFDINLPQPSQSFIQKYVEEYNKGNIITDVLVEYEHIGSSEYEDYFQLKINSKNNTITIRKVKDSWSEEEVIKLLYSYREHIGESSYVGGYEDLSSFVEWIEENL